jgi:hypothetical protein
MADLVPEPDRTLDLACDRVLIDTLPLGLRQSIWNLLKRGARPKQVLARVKGMLGLPRPNQSGHMTYLACEAYIGAVVAGREPDPHDEGPQSAS